MLQPPRPDLTDARPGFREFVVLIAGLMSLNALAIDAMVPALPAIGEALDVADENRRQLVVSLYVLGFGLTQIIYGPLSDRFGRKPVLVVALVLYVGFALACWAAPSFTLLLAARMAQGGAAASTRVLVVSIVRDRYEGGRMARIMSLAFLVFLLVPMLAPVFGQLTLLVASWRAIFFGLALGGAIMLLWTLIRLPETLHPEYRRPLNPRTIWDGAWQTLSDRQSLGYTLAFTLMMASLMGYINSIQQIVFDIFKRPELIAATFAGVALPMAFTSWLNSRIVERVGTRRVAHAGLALFTLSALVHLAIVLTVGESLWLFIAMQGLTMACFGLASANFGSLAMQPLGHVAGTASSVQGTIGTIGGGLLGLLVGQSFDNTLVPMVGGFAAFGAIALLILFVTERGRLFGRG
ncbi:MAG TPA: multidrug effflux MFS transporter [Allosphingosinicella sp.]|jgi:DHA1 family bicyclomycin/chloramphenicol resistance-like MFS transporter